MEKIKSFNELKNKGLHNIRLIDVANSDKSNDIRILIGSTNIVDDAKKHFEKKNINITKLRKDAVIATELVLSLSPSFFKENDIDFKNKFNTKNTKNFINIAKNHIQSKFGDNVISAILHLDETTPHIHVFIIPILSEIDDTSGYKYRLSCKDYFNRDSLLKLQSDYCQQFNDNLSDDYIFEYTRNSKATHVTLKEYYKNANKTQEIIEQKDKKIKSLKNELAVNKYIYDSKIETLENRVLTLSDEIENMNLIIENIKETILKFMRDKIKLFSSGVLKYLNISSEKTETEKMIEYFEKNEIERDMNNKNIDKEGLSTHPKLKPEF